MGGWKDLSRQQVGLQYVRGRWGLATEGVKVGYKKRKVKGGARAGLCT